MSFQMYFTNVTAALQMLASLCSLQPVPQQAARLQQVPLQQQPQQPQQLQRQALQRARQQVPPQLNVSTFK